jgi:hypothetical protein
LLKDGKLLANILSNKQNIDIAYEFLWNQLPWVNDLRSLSHPWLLLTLCKDIRQKSIGPLLQFFVCNNWKTKVQTIQSLQDKSFDPEALKINNANI